MITTNSWQHVAMTYDKASGMAALYCNGAVVATASLGTFTPQTSSDFNLGRRPAGAFAGLYFNGKMDEPSVYNRALSAIEIQTIYNAGTAGKCLPLTTPPVITAQPTNQAVVVGGTANFSVTASGTPPLSYQWNFNDTNIVGATNTTLVLTNVQVGQAGNYAVLVFSAHGSILSSNAVLTVLTPPSITAQPGNQTVVVGGTANFSVTATGSSPLSYRWSFGGTNIAGATNASLTLTNVQLNQAGNYAATITNLYGSILSSNAVLTVIPPGSCTPPPSGLVSWWPGEGNANDIVGTNNGTLQGPVGFAAGEVGQAFVLDGSSTSIRVPASSSLNVGLGGGLTTEVWINPLNFSFQSICEWNLNNGDPYGSAQIGAHLELNEFNADGSLWGNIIDTSGNDHIVNTAGGVIMTNSWQHVAMTYDKASGMAVLYCNGAVVATASLGTFTPQTSFDLFMGSRPSGFFSGLYFNGKMDEPSVYNRALTASEIQAIYNVGTGGKCPLSSPPAISTQPTNQTVTAGGAANFSVIASGSLPLSYQWRLGGTNIVGATNTILTLTNVQLVQAGNYTVLVTNTLGAILSSNAVLTVTSDVDHFTWKPVPSPRYINTGFAISIQARNPTNGLSTSFTGTTTLGSTNGIAVTPPVSGNFDQGVWTGSVVIAQAASNLVLRADDGFGHLGLANPISVISLPSLGMIQSGNVAMFFWPVGYSGFVLETSGRLSPASWVVVPYSPLQIGDQYLLPIDMTGTNGFYRLWFPGP